MNADQFTENCIQRAMAEGAAGPTGEKVQFSFVPILIPFLKTVIEMLMDQVLNCNRSDDEKVQSINSRDFRSRLVMNRAIAGAEWQHGKQERGCCAYVKETILDESGETKDEDLVSLFHFTDDTPHSDARNVWSI